MVRNAVFRQNVETTCSIIHRWSLDNCQRYQGTTTGTHLLVRQTYPAQGVALWDRKNISLAHTEIFEVDDSVMQTLGT